MSLGIWREKERKDWLIKWIGGTRMIIDSEEDHRKEMIKLKTKNKVIEENKFTMIYIEFGHLYLSIYVTCAFGVGRCVLTRVHIRIRYVRIRSCIEPSHRIRETRSKERWRVAAE